jgi:hypothetical protein
VSDSFDSERSETMQKAIDVFRRELEDEDAHIEDAVRAAAFFAYEEALRIAKSREQEPS